jgi:hypothetical protein
MEAFAGMKASNRRSSDWDSRKKFRAGENPALMSTPSEKRDLEVRQ